MNKSIIFCRVVVCHITVSRRYMDYTKKLLEVSPFLTPYLGNSFSRGRISEVVLLVLTSLDKLH